MIGYVSSGNSKPSQAVVVKEQPQVMAQIPPIVAQVRPSVVLRCKQWEDFQALAVGAQTLSFNYKEEEKVFQADALKGSQIINYSGAIPKFSAVLKAYLSKQLNVPEQSILEGVLAPS